MRSWPPGFSAVKYNIRKEERVKKKRRRRRRRKLSKLRVTGGADLKRFQDSLDGLVQVAESVGMKKATAAVDATRKLLESGNAAIEASGNVPPAGED